MTSSTEELRRLLNERGVEYDVRNDFVTHVFFDDRAITFYSDIVDGEMESVSVSVDFPKPVLNGTVWLTPEQAVEAALGGANVDNALILLDEMNEQGRIEYADYSQLHDVIAAMLGRGTCHDVWQDDLFANFKCSECNEEFHYRRDKKRIVCCPFCKREVVRT